MHRTKTPAPRLFSGRTLAVWDESSGYHFVVASPEVEPVLWDGFLSGALAAYRKYKVEAALEYERIKDGLDTTLFFAALTPHGSVVGGSRARGPYSRADEAHVLSEWTDPAACALIREVLDADIAAGVVEGKSGWVAHDVPRRKGLTAAVARMLTFSMELLGSKYLIGSSADNALEMWQRCGGTVVGRIPAAPYPDARYRTRLVRWDLDRCRSEGRTRVLEKLLTSEEQPAFADSRDGLPDSRLLREDCE